jgi:ElaB/YqjD/DUF883 family membrane-anchored ribosome-binding protein
MQAGVNGGSSTVKQGSHQAHKVIQRAANKTVAAVDRVSGAAHGAIDRVADLVGGRSGQLRATQNQLATAYCHYVTTRPFVAVGSALLAGYLIGRFLRR